MTVSAVMPTYNRTEMVMDRSLPSILRQTVPVDEIIIVADGMLKGDFLDMAARLNDLRDIRIKVFNIKRPDYPLDPGNFWSVQGWAARNHGLDVASGDWIAPLDDDDEWTDDHIEVLLAATSENIDFVYGRAITPWGQGYGFWPPSGMNFTDGSQLYRRDLGYRYDPHCIDRWLPADADIWNRMVADGVRFTFVDKLVHRYYPADR